MIGPFIYGTDTKISPLQLLILISVRSEKRYGYEILKGLRDIFKGVWYPKTGVIYPAVKKLKEGELLISEIADDKEYYSLSEKGIKLLIRVLPKLGAMAVVSARFTALTEAAMRDMGLDAPSATDVCCDSNEENTRHLMDLRSHLEHSLTVINEAIDKATKTTVKQICCERKDVSE